MLKRIEIQKPQSPILTATEVMKYRNEKKLLTVEFCTSILEKSDNSSVNFKLLELINKHLENTPKELNTYAEIMCELWFRNTKSKKNTEYLAQIVESNIEKSNIEQDTVTLIYLLSKSENLSPAAKENFNVYLHQAIPLNKEQIEELDNEILINIVKQGAYKDFVTEIVTPAKANPKRMYGVQQELCRQDKLEYNEKVDYIVHAASPANPVQYSTNPVGTILANTLGTYNTLELARKNKAQYCYISTMEIYGKLETNYDIKEEEYGAVDSLNVRSCYPESKKMGENLCIAYKEQYRN